MKTLLKGGNIVNGTTETPFVGDVLIDDDVIEEVGENITCDDARVIDCTGLYVAPGFIDAHSHNDFFYDYDDAEKFYEPFIRQGITTQITGNCGFSPFGIDKTSKFKDKVGGGLFHAKNPGSFREFTENAEGKLFVNFVPLVGHGTTRIAMSGFNPAPLSAKQIEDEMKYVEEAMENGAFGGSFGFMYEPGMYAKKDELYAFAKTIAKYDGILTIHPRAESKVAMGYPLISKPHIEIALDEIIDIMEKTKVRTEYSHLIFVGKSSWPSVEPMLKKLHDYNEKGYKIAYDNYAFTYGASVITIVMPAWYLALPEEKRKSPFNRFRLRVLVELSKKLLGLDFSDFTVAYISDDHKEYENRTISECAAAEGVSDFDMYLKLVDLSNAQGRLYIDKYYNDAIIDRLMKDDLSVFMTDAWVEEAGTQNGAAYQCFPYFLVRGRKNDIPVQNVVNKMTGATAERFKIKDRGFIRKGYFADITVFDYENVNVNPKVADFTPEGIRHVFVNGRQLVNDGIYRGERAGRVILKK